MCTFFVGDNMNDKIYDELYKLSIKAYKKKEVPVSAIITYKNKIIAKAYNKKNINNNVLLHAEVICIKKAYKKLHTWNLNGCKMYVTLEPCDLCKLLIQESRIDKVYYILPKTAITNKYNKTIYKQMFVNNNNYEKLFKNFFKNLRK